MATKVTKQQRDELLASHGQPIPVEDEQAHKVYYLVDADYLHTSREHLKALIQEGVDSNHRPAEEVEEELRQYADRLDTAQILATFHCHQIATRGSSRASPHLPTALGHR